MSKVVTSAPLLVNSENKLIPQYFDPSDTTDSPEGTFKPLTDDYAQKVQLASSEVELQTNVQNFPTIQDVNVLSQADEPFLQEQLTESDTVGGTLTFSEPITLIDIYNQDTVEGIFTVNGFAITVPADTFFRANVAGTPSETVTVTGTSQYIIGRYA